MPSPVIPFTLLPCRSHPPSSPNPTHPPHHALPSPLPSPISLPSLLPLLLPLLLLLSLSLSSLPLSLCETVLYDNCGQGAFLPTTGGNASIALTLMNTYRATSPYILQIAINDGIGLNAIPGERETFYLSPPPYGDALLMSQLWNTDNTQIYQQNYSGLPGTYTGQAASPTATIGLYTFTFLIPVGGFVRLNVTYANTGLNPLTVIDVIAITVQNPVTSFVQVGPGAVGDPQFVGLRGQSYQVHGIDGAVYNIVTERRSQVNSRFVFLSEGRCPVVGRGGELGTDCWSHPGSYLGQMSFQQLLADGTLHRALITSGPASTGFGGIEVDGGRLLGVGEHVEFDNFSVVVEDEWTVHVALAHFAFTLSNSDRFINQAVQALVPLGTLQAHGLLGQTHRAVKYPTAIRYIDGKVDDYLVESEDLWGTDFMFNRFHPSLHQD